MFNCLPGAMLQKGHTHQCPKGFSCSRVPSQHNARMTASHRLFNPGLAGGQATMGLAARRAEPAVVQPQARRGPAGYFDSARVQ
jgi:hypothetical protein